MVMMRGYRVGQNGFIDRAWLDTERWPEGWVDTPDKLDAPEAAEPEPYRAPMTTGEVYGERRKPGWPKGKPRK